MEVLTREKLVSKYDTGICDLCRANGYLDNLAPCSTCEGNYCEYAQDDFAEENDIEIIDL